MALIVQKYGGTSVGTVERVKCVAKHIESFRKAGHDMIITVSAPSGVTDKLIDMTKGFEKNLLQGRWMCCCLQENRFLLPCWRWP